HRPNLRRYARGRPQMLQRLRCWVENFGFLFVLAIFAVVAIFSFLAISTQQSAQTQTPLSGLILLLPVPLPPCVPILDTTRAFRASLSALISARPAVAFFG